MSPGDSSNKEISASIWKFIPLDQYVKPQAPAKETIRTGLSGLKEWLRRSPKPSEPLVVQTELDWVPQFLLDQAAPAPDWQEAAPALTTALDKWLAAGQPEPAGQVVVGAPYSGIAQIISHWAQTVGWRLVDPPSADQILAADPEWLTPLLKTDEVPLVIPHLEHCYLRHYDGLALIHHLLNGLSGRRRHYLIGCDSWAWAYLSKTINIESFFPLPLTLGAFGYEQLGYWFHDLAGRGRGPGFVFRQADYGRPVLPPFKNNSASEGGPSGEPKSIDRDNEEYKKVTEFLSYLASFSFGIPGIAWTGWRYSLRLAPEAEFKDIAPESSPGEAKRTIWVKPWSQLNFPALPTQTERSRLIFILQMLLLHNGLTAPLLSELLPFPASEVGQSLYALDHFGLVDAEQGIWRVTPLAYPTVRRFLEGEGYLVAAI
ncbi:MAG: hypothetical protein ACLFUU_09420 [Desulfobacteraceae bacterium]